MKFPDPSLTLVEQDPEVLLGIAVWAEARGEGPLGRAAVAHVVCNRMRQKGQTVAQVVLKPWAFSCFNSVYNGGVPLEKLLRPAEHSTTGMWALCLKAATEALDGASADPTNGATHYCVKGLWSCPVAANPKNGRLRPRWHDATEIAAGRTTFCASVGNHVFARTSW